MRASAIPGPFAIDLNLQRPAEERSHEHDEPKHANAGEGGVNGDTADDIGNNQQFLSDQDRPPQIQAQMSIGHMVLP